MIEGYFIETINITTEISGEESYPEIISHLIIAIEEFQIVFISPL